MSRPYSQIEVQQMGSTEILERWSERWFEWFAVDQPSEEVFGALRDIAEHLGWLDGQEEFLREVQKMRDEYKDLSAGDLIEVLREMVVKP